MSENLTPQHFRVPREDRSLLFIPDFQSAPVLVDCNRSLFDSSECLLGDRPLKELRSAARIDAITQAVGYTESLIGSTLQLPTPDSVVVSGHQPELFHVGVWAKNFALAGLAKQTNAVPINLVIDNDTLNSTALRIPQGTREHLWIDRVLYDSPRPSLPWEEAAILDRETFQGTGDRLHQLISPTWGFDPLATQIWADAVRVAERSGRLCDGLTAVRSRLERNWGLANLELPMSKLCETDSFRWFVSYLLMRLPELHQIYNEAVSEYRRLHRIRNRMQPVPDLDRADEWLEAPFWIWKKGDSQRGRLFARQTGTVCELRDQTDIIARLPMGSNLDHAVDALKELSSGGYRLRTRALTTTLFARTCLADLFIHGIGGAKYDAMTDRICERIFGIPAPSFLIVSATLYLPIGGPFPATLAKLHDLERARRDVIYNPDRHFREHLDSDLLALISEKNELLATAHSLRASNKLRGRLTSDQHQRLTTIRNLLRSHTSSIQADYDDQLTRLRSQLAANGLVRNREYSFVLYPEKHLRDFLTPISEGRVENS